MNVLITWRALLEIMQENALPQRLPPLDLSPFFCPLPPSLCPSFNPAPLLSLPPSSTHFTFPELPSFPPSLYPLLYRAYHSIPRILRYLRTLTRLGSHTAKSIGDHSPLAVSYKPSASDQKGRLYPYPVGAATLPRALRLLLFGSSHIEIDLVSAHYQLFQCAAHTLLDQSLPSRLRSPHGSIRRYVPSALLHPYSFSPGSKTHTAAPS